jgi:hypothetical protein
VKRWSHIDQEAAPFTNRSRFDAPGELPSKNNLSARMWVDACLRAGKRHRACRSSIGNVVMGLYRPNTRGAQGHWPARLPIMFDMAMY